MARDKILMGVKPKLGRFNETFYGKEDLRIAPQLTVEYTLCRIAKLTITDRRRACFKPWVLQDRCYC